MKRGTKGAVGERPLKSCLDGSRKRKRGQYMDKERRRRGRGQEMYGGKGREVQASNSGVTW